MRRVAERFVLPGSKPNGNSWTRCSRPRATCSATLTSCAAPASMLRSACLWCHMLLSSYVVGLFLDVATFYTIGIQCRSVHAFQRVRQSCVPPHAYVINCAHACHGVLGCLQVLDSSCMACPEPDICCMQSVHIVPPACHMYIGHDLNTLELCTADDPPCYWVRRSWTRLRCGSASSTSWSSARSSRTRAPSRPPASELGNGRWAEGLGGCQKKSWGVSIDLSMHTTYVPKQAVDTHATSHHGWATFFPLHLQTFQQPVEIRQCSKRQVEVFSHIRSQAGSYASLAT